MSTRPPDVLLFTFISLLQQILERLLPIINLLEHTPGSEGMGTLHTAGKRWTTLSITDILFDGLITLLFDNADGDGIDYT